MAKTEALAAAAEEAKAVLIPVQAAQEHPVREITAAAAGAIAVVVVVALALGGVILVITAAPETAETV
jgi:hypothetical protein